ncbi:MAG: DNA polymerase family B elongation subunit [Dasosvirus sp.]|uniref:DNA-directed DNA polymerase n=1 Tax=Dasosvirus sp. TaxID=2487764 RepID=A0A3G4ZTE7_9VIRU|nr:MAG: DNA polymerase family B elongation subunit [Dasosvirus sp.]
MTFNSNNLNDYLTILNNPDAGTQLLSNKSDTILVPEKDQNNDNDQKTIQDSYANQNKDLEFQMIDIDFYHREDEDDDGNKFFNIMLFGKTREDKSVYVNIEGFTPYFYVEVDATWTSDQIHKIMADIKKKVWPKNNQDGLLSYKVIRAHQFYGFTNDENFSFLHLIFRCYDSMRAYARVFGEKQELLYISRFKKIEFKLYESDMNPILRFLHIKNLDPIGWFKIQKQYVRSIPINEQQGVTDINVCCNWKHVERIECSDIHRLKIVSVDIECTSEDGKFPQPERDGDKVIQIGMSYSYLGETECYKKTILCLNKTSKIPDINVISFSDEKDLMLAFPKEIRENDPDIITGYNIFGFDFDYLKKRSDKLKIFTAFSRLSRIKNHVCRWIEGKLESSALGKNKLNYWHTPGRVCVDLMKIVQRDYKLTSYSLDYVASYFIRDKITGYEYIKESDKEVIELQNMIKLTSDQNLDHDHEKSDDLYSSDEDKENLDDDVNIRKKTNVSNKKKILYTRLKVGSTFGVGIGDYIGIIYNDGPIDNKIGSKKKILYIQDKTIIVQGKVRVRPFLKRKFKVFWCQAKDDVEPKDIFRLWNKEDDDRAVVAKYCVKDCSLCNRLLAKLQVLPNSIGMGNVCCVPLSYLFLRGQSIKIYSLVAKQCREENYLIPLNTKKKKKKPDPNRELTKEEIEENKFQRFIRGLINDEEDKDDDDDDQGYEGATVYDPDSGVHYDPTIVGDYGSLYPSSMIEKNFSHNSIVLNPKYDNLPNYIYHSQTYNNSDGTTTTCRFAEKANGEKATIPRILQKLLLARKKYKKLKEIEKDPFKQAIWDGLQNAYKVTANSLYGQCGSTISPISMRAIAACTTALGRERLDLASTFVENGLVDIIRLIKQAVETKNDQEYLEYMRNLYKNVKNEKVKEDKKVMDVGVDGKETERIVKYNDKDEYFQYVKNEIYGLVGSYNVSPKCIYGDTDSVFYKLNLTTKEGTNFRDKEALRICIRMGIITSQILNYTLPAPQALEYEKVYWPFVILSKKRYVGNLYDFKPNSFYQKSMGLVTKRRDNADIVKIMVGGIIDQILNKRDPRGAVKFAQSTMMKIITGKYDIDKFIITKTLKDKTEYKDWTHNVHVVLADRMAQRDKGNKPQSNDRIPFVYVEVDERKIKLQGERVEHPKYIMENKLKIDYLFYITNQIMKPSIQFLDLIAYKPDQIFEMYIVREQNRKSGTEPIMKYFKDVDTSGPNQINIGLGNEMLSGDSLFGAKKPKVNRKRVTKRIVKKK